MQKCKSSGLILGREYKISVKNKENSVIMWYVMLEELYRLGYNTV
jgi:hypothetical protein